MHNVQNIRLLFYFTKKVAESGGVQPGRHILDPEPPKSVTFKSKDENKSCDHKIITQNEKNTIPVSS